MQVQELLTLEIDKLETKVKKARWALLRFALLVVLLLSENIISVVIIWSIYVISAIFSIIFLK